MLVGDKRRRKRNAVDGAQLDAKKEQALQAKRKNRSKQKCTHQNETRTWRPAVRYIYIYAHPKIRNQKIRTPENQEISKSENQKIGKPGSQEIGKSESQKISKPETIPKQTTTKKKKPPIVSHQSPISHGPKPSTIQPSTLIITLFHLETRFREQNYLDLV